MLLFERGGSVERGQLLHYAAQQKREDRMKILQLILAKNPSFIGGMVNKLKDEDSPDDYCRNICSDLDTPLHYAAREGLLNMMQFLLLNGASTQRQDPQGKNAQNWAEYYKQKPVVEELENAEVLWGSCIASSRVSVVIDDNDWRYLLQLYRILLPRSWIWISSVEWALSAFSIHVLWMICIMLSSRDKDDDIGTSDAQSGRGWDETSCWCPWTGDLDTFAETPTCSVCVHTRFAVRFWDRDSLTSSLHQIHFTISSIYKLPYEKAVFLLRYHVLVASSIFAPAAKMETSRFFQSKLRSDIWIAQNWRGDSSRLCCLSVLSNSDRRSHQGEVSSHRQIGIWVYLNCVACAGHGVRFSMIFS